MASPLSTPLSSQTRATLLHTHVTSFLDALTPSDPSNINPPPPPSPPSLISTYFTSSSSAPPIIHEHGPPFTQKLLRFLGRPFIGKEECLRYFELMGAALELAIKRGSVSVSVDADFPESDESKDASADDNTWRKCPGRVLATGQCHCVSRKTGRGWDEEVVWVFSGFEESRDGSSVRFARWDIWADATSAWLAEGGGDASSVGWERGKERD